MSKPDSIRKVHLPTGGETEVSRIGSSIISTRSTLSNVLCLPTFKYNLLSVSKVTRELGCSVSLFPDFCIFQDLSSGRVGEIGREVNGLYTLSGRTKGGQTTNGCLLLVNDESKSKDLNEVELWHKRFGHLSVGVLGKMLSCKTEVVVSAVDKCIVCPCATQARSSFPTSCIKTSDCFELVHMDV